MKNKKIYIITIILIILLGSLIRIIGIDKFPNALNVDEASSGYEAYSIYKYGIDRNGKTMPVFLEAWGSGQNALYSYMIIPFVAILGLNVLSTRLPMALVGCISLFVMYKILEKRGDRKFTVIGLAFFAITPWHIMKSRWGLESNIFPDLMLWASYFLITGIEENKIKKFYVGSVILGLCGYAYGTSYYFLPVFFGSLLFILLKRRKLKIGQAILSLFIVFIICLPIILMLFINSFGFNEIKIFNITIPKLSSNRYETLTVLSSSNIIETLTHNFVNGLIVLILQVDGLNYNSINGIGTIYLTSLPITIVGIIKCIKDRNKKNMIDEERSENGKITISNILFAIWGIVAFTLMLICEPNINRINIIFIPIIYFTILGLYEIIKNFKILRLIVILVYVVQFAMFICLYLNTDVTMQNTWTRDVKDVISYTKDTNADTIYFEYAIKEPYIYVLFYNQYDTREFVNTVKYQYNIKSFDSVMEFGKYRFYIPENITDENAIYVMKQMTGEQYDIDEQTWKKTYINDFVIIEKIKE